MRSLTAASLLLLASLVPSTASATVTQPNGQVMPQDSMNGEVQIYTMFAARGEPIHWQNDAASTPATFSPLCDFRATLVLRETGSSLGVGWYNAAPIGTTPPTPGEIHLIVPAGSPVGTVITGADIRSNPAYAGGDVGFALVGWQTHFTEAHLNPVCTGCASPGPWVMAVIYRSQTIPNAYYVAFEDGPVGAGPGEFNNDGDYNDYVYLFEGLVCRGGGQMCDTGMAGICGQGLTECNAGGVSCRAVVSPTDERCNGLDDNCDGTVDEGDLCPAGQICDRGTCVAHCVEDGCFDGQVCTSNGTCVETACATVTCPAGQVCREGSCRGACDGIVCPGVQVCRAGRCVDPCDGIVCGPEQVCRGGVCWRRCGCSPCDTGLACDPTSGQCVEPGCVDASCSADTVCRAGRCVDPCEGAVCPSGQRCEAGQCRDVPPTERDAGVNDGGSDGDAGFDGSVGDGAMGDGGDSTGTRSGCGCSTPGGTERSFGWAWALGAVLALVRRRRRA
jgi:MYXO-CTERM domain-containing protein